MEPWGGLCDTKVGVCGFMGVKWEEGRWRVELRTIGLAVVYKIMFIH